MARLRTLGVAGLLLLAIGLGTVGSAQHGSFTAEFDVFSLNLAFTLEQQIGEVSGWNIYAGTGFAVSLSGIQQFDPFTSACRELDLFLAYTELCFEGRVNVLNVEQSQLSSFLTTAW